MKYTTHGEHQKFFRTHQYVEFENLLSPEQAIQLRGSAKTIFCSRLKITSERLAVRPFEDLLISGHDCFRQDAHIQRLVTKKNFAELAFELSDLRPIRLAYDHLFFSGLQSGLTPDSPPLGPQHTLREISGLQGSLLALMLCIHPGDGELLQRTPPFASKTGSGIYFSESLPFNFDLFQQIPNACYLMIVYCASKSIVLQEQFFSHSYKELGYSSGDLLKDNSHPILFR